MEKIFLFCVMAACLASTAAAQTAARIARADSLYNHFQEKEALQIYDDIIANNPDDLSALWHSSLLYARLGNRLKDKDQEKAYFNKAKSRAEQALRVDSTSSQANFVMAVAMGRMALIVGAKARVAASRDIKKFADRALQSDSSNAGAWHVLGRWNYEIADLNFMERLAANALFGGIPEGASTENAVKYIRKAISLNPDFILYYRDLARAYKELDQDDKAIQTCRQAIGKPNLAPLDASLKKDCQELIDDLN